MQIEEVADEKQGILAIVLMCLIRFKAFGYY